MQYIVYMQCITWNSPCQKDSGFEIPDILREELLVICITGWLAFMLHELCAKFVNFRNSQKMFSSLQFQCCRLRKLICLLCIADNILCSFYFSVLSFGGKLAVHWTCISENARIEPRLDAIFFFRDDLIVCYVSCKANLSE